jgi:hypothetical protein
LVQKKSQTTLNNFIFQICTETIVAPAIAAPVYSAPSIAAPIYGAHAISAPAIAAPVYGAPAIAAPAYGAPAPIWGGYGGSIAPSYGALGGHLFHKRSAEPSGYEAIIPNCTTVTEKVCSKLPVNTPKTIKVPKCSLVPKEDCKDITKQVPDTQCKDVTRKACSQVPKEVKS